MRVLLMIYLMWDDHAGTYVRTYVHGTVPVRRVVRLMSGVPLARSMFGRWGGARSLARPLAYDTGRYRYVPADSRGRGFLHV